MFFITYANDDAEFVEDLARYLREAGLPHWYDAERLDGKSPIWSADIQKRLLGADAVLLVLSPDCTSSQYATFEWVSAYRAGVPIVPILCRSSLVHPVLAELTTYDFSRPSGREWGKLLDDLLLRFGGQTERRYMTREMPALGGRVDPGAVGALKKLRDADELTREMGVYELAELLPKQPELLNTLAMVMTGDESEIVRDAALRCLKDGRLSRGFLEALSDLYQPDPKRRIQAINTLLQVDDSRVILPLLSALGDADPEVQSTAIHALGVVRDPRSLDQLVELLDGDHAELAAAAGVALRRFGEHIIDPLTDRLPRAKYRERIVETLAATNSRAAVYTLIEELRDDLSPYSMFVARTLAQMGDIAVEAMIYVLKSGSDFQLRRSIVRALGRGKNPAHIKVLVDALANTDSQTRAVITSALISNYGRQILPALRPALKADDWAVRSAAAAIIREMGLNPLDFGYVEKTDYDA